MPDEMRFLERMHQDLREVRWAEPAELRKQGTRRRRRAAVGSAVAVLMVAAVSVVVTKNLAGPPPVAPLAAPTTSVPSAEIPRQAMVQPGDLPVETGPPLGQSGLDEPVQIDYVLLACHQQQGLSADWEPSRYSRSQTLLRAPTGQLPADEVFSQAVYRLAPQVADRIFARIDALLAPCASWRSIGDVLWDDQVVAAEADHRWEVTARDFVGDQAMVIQHSITEVRNLETGESRDPGQLERTAVVRVGDLVTVLGLGRDGTERELRRLAAVAADRLCVAANPPC
ncbi:hypothetical protein ACN26Z_06030 [Verrucosispora sp. WMMD703]|uniref:hypothetical protein n=1 Tax=Verrucosispora sp. WMMD703 TaxID=3403463 RepID=UPI003B955639